jgi:hypothetical protein
MSKPRRWRLAAIAGVLTVGGGLAATLTSTAAQAQPVSGQRASGCITLKLAEPTVIFYSNEVYTPGANAKAGFKGAAFDPIYDTAGNTVGSSVVSSDTLGAIHPPSDHVYEYISETMDLPDGSLSLNGSFDQTTIAALGWLHGKVTGVSGKYAALSGTWTWRLESLLPPHTTQHVIVLCPSW